MACTRSLKSQVPLNFIGFTFSFFCLPYLWCSDVIDNKLVSTVYVPRSLMSANVIIVPLSGVSIITISSPFSPIVSTRTSPPTVTFVMSGLRVTKSTKLLDGGWAGTGVVERGVSTAVNTVDLKTSAEMSEMLAPPPRRRQTRPPSPRPLLSFGFLRRLWWGLTLRRVNVARGGTAPSTADSRCCGRTGRPDTASSWRSSWGKSSSWWNGSRWSRSWWYCRLRSWI